MKRLAALILALAASCWALDLSPVGAPTGGSCTVMDKGFYVICYRADWRIPQWVGEHLTSEQCRVPHVERAGGFRRDPAIPKADQASAADYRASGYDIGHQAPAGDFAFSAEAMRATFVFSNAAPQTPQLNRGPWRDLEVAVRALAASEGDVWVFTGSTASAGQLKGRVRIPGMSWKVLLLIRSDGPHAYAYALRNTNTPPAFTDRAVSLSAVEAATVLHFFPAVGLPDSERTVTHQLPAHAPLPADAEQAKTIHKRK